VLQAQTNPVVHANKLVNHVEGGWPKEIDCTDAEHTIRYRKKVPRSASAKAAVRVPARRSLVVWFLCEPA